MGGLPGPHVGNRLTVLSIEVYGRMREGRRMDPKEDELFAVCYTVGWWVGGWVGEWVGGWMEEKEAVRTRCCMHGVGWVGGWVVEMYGRMRGGRRRDPKEDEVFAVYYTVGLSSHPPTHPGR